MNKEIILICDYCKKDFQRDNKLHQRYKKRQKTTFSYCSRRCRGHHQATYELPLNTQNKTTQAQKLEIVKLYEQGWSEGRLAKKFNINRKSINGILVRRNVKLRPRLIYKIDTEFFDTIDTQEKAYVLGLLYADGYVIKDKYHIGLNLQAKDKQFLEKIRQILKFEKNLKYIKAKPRQLITINKKSYYINVKAQYKISIYNKHMCAEIMKKGCVPKKSLILKFPPKKIVPEYLQSHFIRGYFDGDGCMYKNKKYHTGTFSIISTKLFLLKIKKIFNNVGIYSISVSKQANKNIFTLTCGNRAEILKIFKYMYNVATIYLERKYNKFLLIA